MSYIVKIRKNSTGEIRHITRDYDWFWSTGDGSDLFMWTDGNYACDCNRELFFEEDNDDFAFEDAKCSTDRFTAICAILPDGTVEPIDAPIKRAS